MDNSDHVRLRPAEAGDQQFFFEVRRAAFRRYVEEIFGWNDGDQRITADREFGQLPFQIVEERGEAIGYLCIIYKEDADFIEEIALLPDEQGRGIGTRLVM